MKKLWHYFLLSSLWLLFVPSASLPQTTPVIGLHENTPNVVALTNARIITAPGDTIVSGMLIIRDEQIEAVGKNVDIPHDAVVRDMSGKTLYPGFIEMYSHYGIPEKNTGGNETPEIRHWNDSVRPERAASELFSHDLKSGEKLRKLGFTMVATYPREGIFRGSGALVLLDDGVHEGSMVSNDTGQSLSFVDRGGDYPNSLMGSIALIRQTFLDADWYVRAHDAYSLATEGQTAPEANTSLDVLADAISEKRPMIFETRDGLDIFRAADIAEEFGFDLYALACGQEYRRLDAVKRTGARLIIPLDFPADPDVSTDETSLRDLRHWDTAPENPARLTKAGIEFAVTASGLDNEDDFLKNIRTAVDRGLDTDTALACLTVTPAAWLNKSHLAGSLVKGKLANIVIADGDIFESETKIIETWVAGKRYEITALPEIDVRGTWKVEITPEEKLRTFDLDISGEAAKPDVKIVRGETKINALKPVLDKRILMLAFPADSLGLDGIVRMSGIVEDGAMSGSGTWGDGAAFGWTAGLTETFEAKPDTAAPEPPVVAEFPVVFPDGAFGRESLPEQPSAVLIRNATIWTSASAGVLESSDLLVKAGKIDRIGKNLKAPSDAVVIDAAGKHVTAGLIDAHSHLAVSRGVNEGSHSITSETRIEDVIDCDNINIYRQCAGGLTSACLLHGSANSIGGQNVVVKLRWGSLPDDMIVADAKPTIKFALGENVKRSNVQGPWTTRYPRSRMGVEQFMRDSFQAAKDYREEWRRYDAEKKKNKNLIPPRRDLRLEPLVEVLEGKRWIHCHSYRQDEIQAMIRVADDMGFKVKVFIHNLEGYKVAEIMRDHGSMPTVFSDWWVYKFEVYDAIPYNGAILYNEGLLVSYNSDDIELARRMNLEAAKAVKYGGVPQEEALKFVTINPAIQLGIEHRTGSLEPGKDADFVIWSGSPLSAYSMCEQTWIDGRRYFSVDENRALVEKTARERNTLIQKVLKKNGAGGKNK